MKEFKGTKGDWQLSKTNTFGRQMIDLGDFKGSIDVWYHNGDTMTKEEAVSNAQLISAAPDLLEAALSAIRLVDLWAPNYSDENIKESEIGELASLSMMRQYLEKAINKALGE